VVEDGAISMDQVDERGPYVRIVEEPPALNRVCSLWRCAFMSNGWRLEFCAAYIVPPCKGVADAALGTMVKGSSVPIASIPSEFFEPLFSYSYDEYPMGVAFVSDGQQQSVIRTSIRAVAFGSMTEREDNVRFLAHNLARATDHRSPTGLFVILTGSRMSVSRVVLWKFPADEILHAEMTSRGLHITVVSDAFSRKSMYFKAAAFEGPRTRTSFWKGRVEDLQARYTAREASAFWVNSFLQAQSVLSAPHGTRLLTNALREALDEADSSNERELVMSAAVIIKSRAGQSTTITGLAHELLPTSVYAKLSAELGDALLRTPFNLDPEVLQRTLRFRSLSLDNGCLIRGPLETFKQVVEVEPIDEGRVRVLVEGAVESERVTNR